MKDLLHTPLSKRDLFLFDKIGTLYLSSALECASVENRADLEYLLDAEILFEANYDSKEVSQRSHVDPTANLLQLHASIVLLAALLRPATTIDYSRSKHPNISEFGVIGVHGFFNTELRLVAADLERQRKVRAVPVFPFFPPADQWSIPGNLTQVLQELGRNEAQLTSAVKALPEGDRHYVARAFESLFSFAEQQRSQSPSEMAGGLTDVVEIVLHSLPFASDTVPLEQIIDFRSTGEHVRALQRLRHWMREITKAKKTPVEIAEELEYLLATYQEHVERSRIEAEPAIVESVLTLPFEIAEHLVKFKWGEAAKKLFTLRRRKVALLKAEASAPGREVAYVHHARHSFSRPS